MKETKILSIAVPIAEKETIKYLTEYSALGRKRKKVLTEEEVLKQALVKDKEGNVLGFNKKHKPVFDKILEEYYNSIKTKAIIVFKQDEKLEPSYKTSGSVGFDIEARKIMVTPKRDTSTYLKRNNFFVRLFGKEYKKEERSLDFVAKLFEVNGEIEIMPYETLIFGTDIRIGLPDLVEAQVRFRSGSHLDNGLIIKNGVGTIDNDYEDNEIGIIVYNSSPIPNVIKKGDSIAQVVITNIIRANLPVLEEERQGGFGSTNLTTEKNEK